MAVVLIFIYTRMVQLIKTAFTDKYGLKGTRRINYG